MRSETQESDAESPPRKTEPKFRSLYLKLGIGSALIYLAFLAPGVYTIDGNSMLAVAQSIVLRHSLAVSPGLGTAGPHGQYYSLWYPLLSFIAVPFVAVGAAAAKLLHLPVHYCAALLGLFLQTLIVAATVSLVAALSVRLGADWAGARFAALVFGFGTVAPTYARTFFADPLLGLLTATAVYLAFADRPGSSGGASALAVLAKPPGIFAGPVLSLYVLLRKRTWRWLLPGAGAALGAILYLGYNVLRFGRPLALAAHPAGNLRLSGVPVGLAGLLFSPGFGVVWFCPVVIVAATAGLAAGWKRRPRETGAVALICLADLGLYSAWSLWQGGWSWGPRFLFPTLAILLPFLGLVGGRWKKAALALAVVGFLVSAPTWTCFFERSFAEEYQQGIAMQATEWSVDQSPLVRMWPAAWHQFQDAARTDPRMLLHEAETQHAPAHAIASSRALRIVAVWWWLLPAVGISRWLGVAVSLVLVVIGVILLRAPPPKASQTAAAGP